MRQAFIALLFFLFLNNPYGYGAKPKAFSEIEFHQQLKAIELFEKNNQFEKAQKAYEKLSKKNALTNQQRKAANRKWESLNIKMFLSPAITPGSIQYTVKKGDKLFDLSKKFHTTMELIRASNGLKKDELQEGDRLKIVQGKFLIKVDKSKNRLELLFNKKHIKEYPVTTGANNKTPVGKYKIVTKVEDPTWYYEKQVIPAGSKKNMLGTRWLGFDIASYGIHGTTEPEEIGKQASLGCVRMLNPDVEELYTLVPLETSVTIID